MLNAEQAVGWDGRGSPTASSDLEELLRRAAQRAGQDGVPASVHDVLRAAVTSARDGGAAAVLLHAASDPQALERWASEPTMPLNMGAPPSLQLASLQPDIAGARLDQLEASMRALATEVAADRKAIVDMLAELQQDIRASRSDPPAALGEIQEALDSKVADLDRSISALSQRFETVRGFTAGAPDVEERLAALETRIGGQPPAIAEAVSYMLSQRHDEREAEVAQRLAAFEGTMRAQAERMEQASKTHEHDLSEVYEALVKIGTNQQTLGSTWRRGGWRTAATSASSTTGWRAWSRRCSPCCRVRGRKLRPQWLRRQPPSQSCTSMIRQRGASSAGCSGRRAYCRRVGATT